MPRRTKIVATLGPASNSPAILRAMLIAGVDVLRVNFSHANETFAETVKTARSIAAEINRPLAIMADLQGPKIRIGRFKKHAITLIEGKKFTLNCQADDDLGDETGVSVVYTNLCNELAIGDRLLLDDGLIELAVTGIHPPLIDCTIIEGGMLQDHKGINRKGGGLAAGALTDKDKQDMKTAVEARVDYLALSFVKDTSDIHTARQLLAQLNAKDIPIIVKIERTEALNNLAEIIAAADAIMVARGDLGVEIGAAEVPAIQKRIIEQTRQLNKVVITATQMMESMTSHPQPTRAEVSDVANAILDGTDAVMLSAETATGLYPVKVITMVDKICLSAEKHAGFYYHIDAESCNYQRADQAIAMASMYSANHFPVKAILALTESGATAIWMSRLHSTVPIYAITANKGTVNKLSLVNNVFPLFFDYSHIQSSDINQHILNHFLKLGLIEENMFILLTRGHFFGQEGGTNQLQIIQAKLS